MPENTSKNPNPKQDQRRGETIKPQKPDGSDTTVNNPNRNRQDPSKLPAEKGRASEDIDLDDLDDDDSRR
jgi:hypothetical protein